MVTDSGKAGAPPCGHRPGLPSNCFFRSEGQFSARGCSGDKDSVLHRRACCICFNSQWVPRDEQRTVCAAVSQSVGLCGRTEGRLVGTEVRDTILVLKELPVSWEVGHTGSFPAVKLLLSLLGYQQGLIRGKKGLEVIHIYRNYGTYWVMLGKSLNLLAVSFFVYKRRELD